MITGGDMYTVLSAMVPLYVAMMLGYASVRWWGIFSAVQCSGINRFVAVFAVPLLSFTFISGNNPYKMDGAFILADTASKLAALAALVLWTQARRFWPWPWFGRSAANYSTAPGGAAAGSGGGGGGGGLDWLITLFSLATLPNTLVMGIPLLRAMYGPEYGNLMVQVVVLQSIIWYTLLLFLFELRAAMMLLKERLAAAGGGGAAAIVGVDVDPDVVSLDGREPLHTEAHVGDDGKIRVLIRRSVSVSSSSRHNQHHNHHDFFSAAAGASSSPPRRSAAANFYSPHRHSTATTGITDFYVPSSPGRRSTSVMNLDLYGASPRISTSVMQQMSSNSNMMMMMMMDMSTGGAAGGGGGYAGGAAGGYAASNSPRRSSVTAASQHLESLSLEQQQQQLYYNLNPAIASAAKDLTLGFTSTFTEPSYLRATTSLPFYHLSPRTSNFASTNYDFNYGPFTPNPPLNYSRQSSHCPTPRTSMTSIPPPPSNYPANHTLINPPAAPMLDHHQFVARRDRDLPLELIESAHIINAKHQTDPKASQTIESSMGDTSKTKTIAVNYLGGEPQSIDNVIGNDENIDQISSSIATNLQNNTPSKLQRLGSTNNNNHNNEKSPTYIDDAALTTKAVLPSPTIMAKLILKMVSRKLIRNPNTYASLIGVVWSLIAFRYGIGMPKIVSRSLQILSQAGLGMAMFSLGLFMALQPKIIACGTYLATFAMVVRFFIGPIIMSVASIIVGLRGVHLHAAIVQAALPQGIVPFVFSREYDLHPEILSTAVIFGMLVALPTTLLYYVLLGI